MRIVMINGPNLNLLGERDPDLYGTRTLADIEAMVRGRAQQRQAFVRTFQSNAEGAIIDVLHEERRKAQGFLLNAGALTHSSYALHDAIAAIRPPVVEVHMTNLEEREEPWRRISVIEPACAFRVMGRGAQSYLIALDRLLDRLGAPSIYGG